MVRTLRLMTYAVSFLGLCALAFFSSLFNRGNQNYILGPVGERDGIFSANKAFADQPGGNGGGDGGGGGYSQGSYYSESTYYSQGFYGGDSAGGYGGSDAGFGGCDAGVGGDASDCC